MGSALFLQLTTNTSQLVGNKFSAIGITSFSAHTHNNDGGVLLLLLDSKGARYQRERKKNNNDGAKETTK